jgi:hypothetical protein
MAKVPSAISGGKRIQRTSHRGQEFGQRPGGRLTQASLKLGEGRLNGAPNRLLTSPVPSPRSRVAMILFLKSWLKGRIEDSSCPNPITSHPVRLFK